ncbi:hypothetical protein LTR37_002812 [Vermiconidia calcicola]|uniref:Uncharacterized protein n=1 Tax=Vermiconidia calcicola TaxID=1690605 RepID=A0ACC3NS81_9PEZI|nr:hypothetical protein LTR37_002812 [Vermiconidia calcicola]
MRPSTLITTLCALSTSALAQNFDVSSFDLSALTASAGNIASPFAGANPTSLLESAGARATEALQSLSDLAATATGPLGRSLRAQQTTLANLLSQVENSQTEMLSGLQGTRTGGADPTGSAGASASAAATGSDLSAGLAAATGVPLAAGAAAIGMAALALL